MVTEVPEILLPGLGHNNPPFDELLAEEQKDYAARIEKMGLELDLIDKVDDEVDYEKAIAAVKRCNTAIATIEADRKKRNVEFDDKIKIVNVFFRKLGDMPVNQKTRLIGLIDDYKAAQAEIAKQKAAREAEKLADEARVRREAAQEAGGVLGEVLEQEADKREQEAASKRGFATDTKAEPLRTASGSAGERKTVGFRVKDGNKIPLAKLKGHFDLAALEKAIRSYVKAQGKTSKELPELNGVEFYWDTKTVVR